MTTPAKRPSIPVETAARSAVHVVNARPDGAEPAPPRDLMFEVTALAERRRSLPWPEAWQKIERLVTLCGVEALFRADVRERNARELALIADLDAAVDRMREACRPPDPKPEPTPDPGEAVPVEGDGLEDAARDWQGSDDGAKE